MKREKKNLKTSLFSNFRSVRLFEFLTIFVCCFFFSGTHMSFFLPLLVRLSPETNDFVPVSISFILNEYSLFTCHFSEFLDIPVFRFHSKPVA